VLFKELAKRMMDVGVLTLFCWGDQESETFWTKQVFVDYFLSHGLILLCLLFLLEWRLIYVSLCLMIWAQLDSGIFESSRR